MPFVGLLSQPLTTKFDIFLRCGTYDFAYNITNVLYIPAIFIFCLVFDARNEMQMSLSATNVSS